MYKVGDYVIYNHDVCKIIGLNSFRNRDYYVLNRKKLKEFGLSDSNINKISIKLQLLGLDFNGRKY